MIDWIRDVIDPPGMDKKNRLAFFETIGDVMARVLDDAKKAFNAHYPYLADEKKLEEHGRALAIPHLFYDKPEEYRNRVAAASFFLMKAGERGFIMNVIRERFNDRFQIVEKFLQLQVKIAQLTVAEKKWVLSLLDFLINPVVSFEITQWLLFFEHIPAHDTPAVTVRHHHLYNGRYSYDGEIDYSGEHTTEVELI